MQKRARSPAGAPSDGHRPGGCRCALDAVPAFAPESKNNRKALRSLST